MKTFIFIITIFISLPLAAKKMDILRIYEFFVLSSAASSKCIKPSEEKLTSFLANYQMVTVSTLKEIKKRKPSYTQEKAESAMKTVTEKQTQKVNALIAKSGCSHPNIQALIKQFHVQAKWKP